MSRGFFQDESCTVYDLNRIAYRRAYALQQRICRLVHESSLGHTLLLLEHEHVITVGKSGASGDILLTQEALSQKGISVEYVDRGGQVTFHGPGQLVGYLLFDIRGKERALRSFMKLLETSLAQTLSAYELSAEGNTSRPGLWLDDRKIASVGIAVHRGITMHGFALNASVDLRFFRYIVPCGIERAEITSIGKETSEIPDMQALKQRYIQKMREVFAFSSCVIKTLPASLLDPATQIPDDENALLSGPFRR